MPGLMVFIICIFLAVLTYRKVSNRSRNKGRGKIRTLITSLAMSFIVFMASIGIGAGVISQDKNTNINAKASPGDSTKKTNLNIYTCNKFEAITQTRQGTKHNSGFYSDNKTNITYSITDTILSTKMVIPGFDDSTETAKFNKIAADGSRKYGNSSSNYFVSYLNDNTIRIINVNFNANMTLTQICSK